MSVTNPVAWRLVLPHDRVAVFHSRERAEQAAVDLRAIHLQELCVVTDELLHLVATGARAIEAAQAMHRITETARDDGTATTSVLTRIHQCLHPKAQP